MLFSIHKEKTDETNLKNATNAFCERNKDRRSLGSFCDTDTLKKKKKKQLANGVNNLLEVLIYVYFKESLTFIFAFMEF